MEVPRVIQAERRVSNYPKVEHLGFLCWELACFLARHLLVGQLFFHSVASQAPGRIQEADPP